MHDARDRNQGVWIEHSDRLYVAAYSSVASLVVTFSGYFRKMDGTIIEWAQTINPTSDRAVTATTVFFGAGFLLSCVATLTTGSANRGQCYVRAMVQRSTGAPALNLHNIVGGYVTDDFTPSFPYGKIEGPLEGPGMIRVVIGAVPAAGDDIVITVPTGARWRLFGFNATLITSGTVATRHVLLYLNDGSQILWQDESPSTQTATLSYIYSAFPGGIEHTVRSNVVVMALPPDQMLKAGAFILSVTGSIAASDTWGAPVAHVEEWLEA